MGIDRFLFVLAKPIKVAGSERRQRKIAESDLYPSTETVEVGFISLSSYLLGGYK